MQKLKIAIIGYGNVGRFALSSIKSAPDMELSQIIITDPKATAPPAELAGIDTALDLDSLKTDTDVALLCLPTLAVPEYAATILAKGINTVDPYDLHGELLHLRNRLMPIAQKYNSVAVVSAGWDPGTDSIIRCLLEVMAPKGITYTNFGPGMSMGHSVAVKAIPGIVDALSLTIPKGTGIHRRMVYVELREGADFDDIANTIKMDPYFVNDETHVFKVPSVNALKDMGHGVVIERKGVSGDTHNQIFSFEMRINNPALTAQAMVASARASKKQLPGAYTMIEIPIIDYMYGNKETIISHNV